jgi:hypothetical protein
LAASVRGFQGAEEALRSRDCDTLVEESCGKIGRAGCDNVTDRSAHQAGDAGGTSDEHPFLPHFMQDRFAEPRLKAGAR